MREDLGASDPRASAAVQSAIIIPFPSRAQRAREGNAADVINAIAGALEARNWQHAPTALSACGALAGFAAQQALLLEGGAAWAQPMRAERLDRLLMSSDANDASLWWSLTVAAHAIGAQHLPDAQKLLATTLKCQGTNQFGQITLPLEYKLHEQPQTSLVRLWARVREALEGAQVKPATWPRLLSALAAERVVAVKRDVPPHVAVRIVMQAAFAMALLEPRHIPGAALKAE